MLLGCIGDDFTGSSDLANTLAKQGMRTVQYTGVPSTNATPDVEAGVIALKSRSIPVAQAVEQALAALDWLKAQGCRQFFFKYCSTFDSTPEGNIGPVIDALAEAIGTDCVIVCPAFPGAGRTLYQGHLFINDTLLNECGMQNHPLTPMTDPDIRRWLAPQTKHSIGHVPESIVLQGASATKEALLKQSETSRSLIVVDAIRDEDLMTIGAAAADLPLITGGSGVALGLPENFRQQGLIGQNAGHWQGEKGRCAIISGSCSRATREQLEIFGKYHPTLEVNVQGIMDGTITAESICQWMLNQPDTPLVYSSANPQTVKDIQEQFGREASASAIENLFAETAKCLHANGFNRLIVAGGETSGAVVEALDINATEIGPEIDPGVPCMRAGDDFVIALKSGNFGAPDFFEKAIRQLEQGAA